MLVVLTTTSMPFSEGGGPGAFPLPHWTYKAALTPTHPDTPLRHPALRRGCRLGQEAFL